MENQPFENVSAMLVFRVVIKTYFTIHAFIPSKRI